MSSFETRTHQIGIDFAFDESTKTLQIDKISWAKETEEKYVAQFV
jgi:hypothetical protein